MKLGAKDSREKIPNHYRPSKVTSLLAFLALMAMTFVNYRAVHTADKGLTNATNDAEIARIAASDAQTRLIDVQKRLDCTGVITLKAIKGSLQNSIFQDDLLLASVEGNDRTVVLARLKQTRADLQALTEEVAQIEQRQQCS